MNIDFESQVRLSRIEDKQILTQFMDKVEFDNGPLKGKSVCCDWRGTDGGDKCCGWWVD